MKLKRITAFLLPGITLLEKTPADLSYIIRLAPTQLSAMVNMFSLFTDMSTVHSITSPLSFSVHILTRFAPFCRGGAY